MEKESSVVEEPDWEDLYVKLYAFTHDHIQKFSWFRGSGTDSFLQGKQVHDYVMEAIEKYLLNPEKFDSSKRKLENYIKMHIIRTLIWNDKSSSENKSSKDILNNLDSGDNEEEGNFLDSILPFIEANFDQQMDYNLIMSEVSEEIKNDTNAEHIFTWVCCAGFKRRDVIQQIGITSGEYDNGMRRLNTVLKNIAKKYNLNAPSL